MGAACALAPALLVGSAAAEADVSFSIGQAVSREDASYVREGVALAQTYVEETLTGIPDTALAINVRESADAMGGQAVAFSGGDFIVVFTGSPGWVRLAPFDRVHVVVHEYIHAYQHAMLGGGEDELPIWFVEGMAEYLSYDAIARMGLVRAGDAGDFHAWAVVANPDLPALAELEERDAFYDDYGPVYSLAYQAIAELLGGRAPAELDRFLAEVRGGDAWRDAFEEVFGQDLETFYGSFAEAQEALLAPVSMPESFATVFPAEIEGAVAIDAVSDPVAVGGQLAVLGRADAGAVCRLRLRGEESGKSVARTTFADASGRLFWLVTIPATLGQGPAALTAHCGGARSATEIEIAARGR